MATHLFAQMPGGSRSMGAQNMNIGHFYGKIVDSASNKALEFISVQLLQTKLDTATKKRKDVVVAGMLTTKNGAFSLENLAVMAPYKLKITGIGYKPIEQKVFFNMKMGGDMSQMLNGVDKDLGNIKLVTDAKQLAEVSVSGSRGLLQMGIDRKIFNVDKNLTSVGGTAVDVMKSVPSVNVDIDGNVTLRNAPPQIFVDGRPTTLTLDQIPADAIQSVEIITNPSAKFDASGGGSGILNIVLKKARKAGYNGNVRTNVDSRGRVGLGGDFNIKQGKFNVFANTMYAQQKSLSTAQTIRTDFLNAVKTAHTIQNSAPVNKGFFGFFRAGFDFFADIRNTFTVAGAFVRGKFHSEDHLNILRDTNYVNPENGITATNGNFSFRNYGSTLSYKHNFAKAGKDLTADVNYNKSKNENASGNETQYYNLSTGFPKGSSQQLKSSGGGNSNYLTVQTDFVNPVTEKMKIEMGARVAIRNFTSMSNTQIYDNGNYITLKGLSNNYKFKDEVYAAYTTFTQAIKKFSYQLGIRVESSKYTGDLIDSNKTFTNHYPFSFFPSAFLTQKINDKQSLQLNYSRKINRPNFFQLLPYIDFTDSLNLSKGNPNLIPEFTNLLEFSYQVDLNKGNSFLATAYYKNTNDLITRFQYKDKNPNQAKNDSVVISTFANANTSYAYGLELTGKIVPAKFWDITANANLYNSQINGNNIQSNLNNQQVSWFGKINNSFKLPKNYSIQFTANYQSKTILPAGGSGGNRGGGMMFGGGQISTANGYIKPNYGFDIAFRKDFLKNNTASLTLSINDVFKTKVYSTHSESRFFIQDNERRRDPQVARLNFNWRFGKFDVSLFKRKNLKGEQEGMQNGMQGIGQ